MPIDFAFRTLMTHPAESGFSTVSPSALSPPSRCPPVVDGGAFMLCLARRGGSLRAALGRRAAFRMNAQAFGVAVPGNRSGCLQSVRGAPLAPRQHCSAAGEYSACAQTATPVEPLGHSRERELSFCAKVARLAPFAFRAA